MSLFLVTIKELNQRLVVFMLPKQQSFILSPYIELYNILIPKDNLLRRMDETKAIAKIMDEPR